MIKVSLQNYTTYSELSGLMNPHEWVAKAVENGLEAIAITDKQNLIGAFEWQKECLKAGIKPIIGEEFLLSASLEAQDQPKGCLLILAKDEAGYKNLVRLNNISNRRKPAYSQEEIDESPCKGKMGFYFRPRIDIECLREYSDGLICIAPSEHSIGATDLSGGKFDFANESKSLFAELSLIFKEDFYIGINPRLDDSASSGLGQVNAVMRQLPYKKVFTFNCHHPDESQAYLLDVVKRLSPRVAKCVDRPVDKGHLPSSEEKFDIPKAFYKEAVSNMEEIVDKCNFTFETGNYKMPKVYLREGFATVKEDIMAMIGEGFKSKLCPTADFDVLRDFDQLKPYEDMYPFEHINKGESEEDLSQLKFYIDQLKYEFKIIEDLGFFDYFHTVKDFCDFVDSISSKKRGIARGSAAGALFSYLLHIVRIDPVRHGLFFERFLNPDRQEIPDIDLDFSTDARDALKAYIIEKHGAKAYVNIGTTQRYKIVSAIKDVAKAYGNGIMDNEGNIVMYNDWTLNSIVSNLHVTATKRGRDELEEMKESHETFREFAELHSEWIDKYIIPLQDTVKNLSVHASGSLVLTSHVDDHLPIREDDKGMSITFYNHKDCEAIGYPKFDLLVVDAFDVISYTSDLVKKRHGKDIPEWEEVPLHDEAAIKIINKDQEGIFQLHTYSFKQFLKVLKPKVFGHVAAAMALNRPGPISAGAPFIFAEIINGLREAEYDTESLRPVLEETEGLIVYQEQMMKTAVVLSGFDGKESDHLRKATGKKLPQEMKKWEERFIEGGVSNGYDRELMEKIWGKLVGFADYSFNKAHAVSYAAMSWYQAYLKARYPLEFYCGVLNFAKTDAKKDNSVMQIKKRAENRGLEFVLPKMEAFSTDFEPAGGNKIFYPLWAIGGVGPSAIASLRELGVNSFSSMDEMLDTLDSRYWRKNVYEALIKAGFFESMGSPWEVMEIYYQKRADRGAKKEDIPFEYQHKDPFKWILFKNDAYGTQMESWKKLAPFNDKVQTYTGKSLKETEDGEVISIGGIITQLRVRKTKYGKWFARMVVEDIDERYTVMMWSEFWDREDLDITDSRPQVGQLVQVTGVKDSWQEYPQVVLKTPDVDNVTVVWQVD